MNAQPKLREIYLTPEKPVFILDQVFFQTGDDGVHQWESGIVLARYLLSINPSGSLLELGSGCGLVGITCSKYTNLESITLTDFNSRVLENLTSNLARNDARASVRIVDWRDPSTYAEPADYVVGSDLIYDGAPIRELVSCLKAHLKENGKIFIVMPDKRKMTPVFLQVAQESGLETSSQVLEDWFVASPHLDEKKGFQEFAELTMRKYVLYTLNVVGGNAD